MHKNKLSNNQGFSLFEVLVAIFILSFGLLGMVGVYVCSLKRADDSFRQTLAISKLISAKEELYVSKKNCSSFNLSCESLLPNCEFRCSHSLMCIQWGLNNKQEQCLVL